MTNSEKYLAIAQEIREDPSRWTQSVAAKDSKGHMTSTKSPDATCWCAIGFTLRDDLDATALYSAVRQITGGRGVTGFNDAEDRTPGEIAGLFELASELADSSGT